MTAAPKPPPPTFRTLVVVGLWGATTTVVAYAVSGGSLPVFIGGMAAIGVLQRVAAVRIRRARGESTPPWWRI